MKTLQKCTIAAVTAMTLAVSGTSAAAEVETIPAPPSQAQQPTMPAPAPWAPAAPARTAQVAPVAQIPQAVAVPAPVQVAHVPQPVTQAPAPLPATIPAPASQVAEAPAQVAAPPAEIMLRPTRQLVLAEEPKSAPITYKLLFGALVGGAALVAWKKRRGLTSSKSKNDGNVRVLGRTPMGLRGEIVLVDVGSTRVLVGVTPSSMTTLALLPEETMNVTDEEIEPEPAPTQRETLAERARILLGMRDNGPSSAPMRPAPTQPAFASHAMAASRYAEVDDAPPARPRAPKESTPRRRAADAPLEGQARGLALALGNRR